MSTSTETINGADYEAIVSLRSVLRFAGMDAGLASKLLTSAKEETAFFDGETLARQQDYVVKCIIHQVWELNPTLCNPKPVLVRLATFAFELVTQ